MADPSVYEVDYSFAGFQANAPATPLPGASIDAELANIATAVAGLVSAVKDTRRADGALKNGVVTLESVSVGVIAGLSNLDTVAAAELDAAVAAVQTNIEAELTVLDAAKADAAHTHTAAQVSVSAISGVVGTTVQAVLAELRAYAPRTGSVRLDLDDAVPAGWVACDDGTIGDAGSAATNRANADVWALYSLLWTKVSDTYAPVTGTRGLSAALDFAALKPIALTKMLGRALAVAGSGAGLTTRTDGETAGAETHVLTSDELPANIPNSATSTSTVSGGTYAGTGYSSVGAGVNMTGLITAPTGGDIDVATATTVAINAAGGGAHTSMQPTAFLHAFMKL